MKRILLISTMVFFVIGVFVANTYAVPNLGVATEYAYVFETGQTGLADYQDYFVNHYAIGTDENHGFLIGPSGDDLIVFTHYTSTPLWLLTTSAVESANDPTVGGLSLSDQSSLFDYQIDGYKPEPYYGVSLGTTADTFNGYSWVALPEDFPGSQQFYALYLPLEYTGAIAEGSYFFVATDPALVEGNDFSPKTDSAVGGDHPLTPIPEPATMLLLGSGLIGIAGIGRKKLKK